MTAHLINDVILCRPPQYISYSSIQRLLHATDEWLKQQLIPPELQPVWIDSQEQQQTIQICQNSTSTTECNCIRTNFNVMSLYCADSMYVVLVNVFNCVLNYK